MRNRSLGRYFAAMSPDPRGPLRRVTTVGLTDRTNHMVTLECGHVPNLAPHFTYKVGSYLHCFQCGPKGAQSHE